jgi:hypothetical protein
MLQQNNKNCITIRLYIKLSVKANTSNILLITISILEAQFNCKKDRLRFSYVISGELYEFFKEFAF